MIVDALIRPTQSIYRPLNGGFTVLLCFWFRKDALFSQQMLPAIKHDSHYHLTQSNVTSKLTTLPGRNSHQSPLNNYHAPLIYVFKILLRYQIFYITWRRWHVYVPTIIQRSSTLRRTWHHPANTGADSRLHRSWSLATQHQQSWPDPVDYKIGSTMEERVCERSEHVIFANFLVLFSVKPRYGPIIYLRRWGGQSETTVHWPISRGGTSYGAGGPPPRFRCNGARLDLCPPLSDGITVYGAAEIRWQWHNG